MPSEPLTTRQVIDGLAELIAKRPELADRPVHILDFDPDSTGPEMPWDGLVTMIDVDCYDEQQGVVVCLNAYRDYPEWIVKVKGGGEVSGRE